MTHATTRRQSRTCFWVLGLITVLLSGSIADANRLRRRAARRGRRRLCDYRAHPTITAVTPTRAKPGQRITISGKNFGSKRCFPSVSFGPKSTDQVGRMWPNDRRSYGAQSSARRCSCHGSPPRLAPRSISLKSKPSSRRLYREPECKASGSR